MNGEVTVELGDEVSDPITGFKGVAIAVTQWMFGCRRITVQPKGLDKDSKPYETQTFDEPGLKVTKRAKVPEKVKAQRARNGGPRPDVRKPEIRGR